MSYYLKDLWAKLVTWNKARANHNRQPLNRENAYVLSILGKEGSYQNVLNNHIEWLLKTIKEEARLGNNYLLWKRLEYITPTQKKELVDYLDSLGYQVLYTDENVMLITWLWSPNDFHK